MKNSTVRLVPIALVLLMFFSCNKNGEVKQFMADFSTAIANKDRATIEKMYPDAAKADSLALDFDAENAQIETLDDGSIKVVNNETSNLITGLFSAKAKKSPSSRIKAKKVLKSRTRMVSLLILKIK